MMIDAATVFGQTQKFDEGWLSGATHEDPIDPELPIVDTHMHMWERPGGFKYLLQDYAADVAGSGHRIESSIYVECRSMYRAGGIEALRPLGETEFAAEMGAMADSGLYTSTRVAAGIVAYADPSQGGWLEDILDGHQSVAGGRLRGIRRGAKWDSDPVINAKIGVDRPGIYCESAFLDGLKVIAKRDLAFEVSIFHPQIPDVTAMAQALPDLQIVLIHSGSPVGYGRFSGRETEMQAAWLADMKVLASCSNVSVKIGGLLMSLANFDFGTAPVPPSSAELVELWRPFLEPCIDLFGCNRCMVESNFPVDKRGVTMGAVWNMFKRLTTGYSADERQALFSGTARRIYKI